ncbi:hypothetical protein FO519_002302 [Halicephalobus sp. NKZ332]|nr:hypothetical protein FO519_002302 [Halicephalobus sp. NKZ332]
MLVSRFARPTIRWARLFSSNKDDSDPTNIHPKQVVDEKLKEALDKATTTLYPNDKQARTKLTDAALKKLTEIEFDSFQNATSAQTADVVTDSVLANLQGLQIRRPSVPSYSKDLREANQVRVALRREIFHEAVKKGLSAKEARGSAEKILPVVEQVIASRRQEKFKSIEEEVEKFDKADNRLTVLDKELLDYILTKRDNVFYSDEELLKSTSTETRPAVNPEKDTPGIFNDSSIRLNIFSEKLTKNNLSFWKKWEDDHARVTNLSMGPRNAIEEQIMWTEQGRMWPYPVNNEYLLGEEENVSFMDHIFLDSYLKKHKLPQTGPVAHFMELVCVGLSKNPYMTAIKKREHLDSFAKYFNPEFVKKVEQYHEQEQLAAANA